MNQTKLAQSEHNASTKQTQHLQKANNGQAKHMQKASKKQATGCVMLRSVMFRYIVLCCVVLRCIALCCVVLRYVALCCVEIRCVALCRVALCYIVLSLDSKTTLHQMPLSLLVLESGLNHFKCFSTDHKLTISPLKTFTFEDKSSKQIPRCESLLLA